MKNHVILFAILLVFSCFSAQGAMRVLFVNPSTAGDPFWHKVETFSVQAAGDLEINLDIVYGDGHREFQHRAIARYLATHPAPDYAVLINYPGGNGQSMQLLEQHGVYFVTLEETLSQQERELVRKPGERFHYWLAELSHDNQHAGQQLASFLHEKAVGQGIESPLVAAIGGHYGGETNLRVNGLRDFLADQQGQLVQVVHGRWQQEIARQQTAKLLQRYPELSIIWCASDAMAMAAAQQAQQHGKVVNKDMFIGGFDWLADSLSAIADGRQTASVGGHFLMGAWALVKAYDHRFSVSKSSTQEVRFKLAIAHQGNVKRILPLVDPNNWQQIDFKSYTRTHNSTLDEYPFDVQSILNQHF